jgi:hypothetical protein
MRADMQKYYSHLALAPIVLVILAEEDDHGYAILQRVGEF